MQCINITLLFVLWDVARLGRLLTSAFVATIVGLPSTTLLNRIWYVNNICIRANTFVFLSPPLASYFHVLISLHIIVICIIIIKYMYSIDEAALFLSANLLLVATAVCAPRHHCPTRGQRQGRVKGLQQVSY
jgi:hypothetical protein